MPLDLAVLTKVWVEPSGSNAAPNTDLTPRLRCCMAFPTGFTHQAAWSDTELLFQAYLHRAVLSKVSPVGVDLPRFRAAPGARLSHFPFEGDRAFPAQC